MQLNCSAPKMIRYNCVRHVEGLFSALYVYVADGIRKPSIKSAGSYYWCVFVFVSRGRFTISFRFAVFFLYIFNLANSTAIKRFRIWCNMYLFLVSERSVRRNIFFFIYNPSYIVVCVYRVRNPYGQNTVNQVQLRFFLSSVMYAFPRLVFPKKNFLCSVANVLSQFNIGYFCYGTHVLGYKHFIFVGKI